MYDDIYSNRIISDFRNQSAHIAASVLGRCDPRLGDLFDKISAVLLEEMPRILEEGIAGDFDVTRTQRMASSVGSLGGVNVIPDEFGQPAVGCLRECVVFALGKWNKQDPNGLPKTLAKIFSYWSDCQKNEVTLIISSAWDEKSFYDEYAKYLRSNPNRSVAVVLATRYGFSVQYIGN